MIVETEGFWPLHHLYIYPQLIGQSLFLLLLILSSSHPLTLTLSSSSSSSSLLTKLNPFPNLFLHWLREI